MKRLVHLSDLHFGRVSPALEGPLIEAVTGIAPDLVVISGDLTQRARDSQFRAARGFLDRLPAPWLAVPGNHDTPLDNIAARMFRPFDGYRTHICEDLEPVHEDEDMVVAGVNTVNRFSWQRGKVGSGRLARLESRLQGAGNRLKVAVLHHPLEHGPGTDKRLMRGAGRTLAALGRTGADVVLSGHLHVALTRPFAAATGVLFVQAGTGLSTRLRDGEPNTFNQLDCTPDRVTVTTWGAQGDAVPVFSPAETASWHQGTDGWIPEQAETLAPVE